MVDWPSTSSNAEQLLQPQAASAAPPATELVLTLDCPEKPGIVHAVSGVLLAQGCNIVELTQFDDRRLGHF